MCPNCVTPWKCNGERTAFLAEQLREWHDQERPGWAVLTDTKVVRVESLDIELEPASGSANSRESLS